MNKKIELFLNIIHYCLYKADYKRHLLTNKVNPFLLIGKIPAVRRKHEELGTTGIEVANKIWGDKRVGFSIMIAGGGLIVVIFAIILMILAVINSLFYYPVKDAAQLFIISTGLALLICYFTVFKKSKYLLYFKQFDKWTRRENWMYGLLSFAVIAAAFILFFYSFRFLAHADQSH